MKDETKQTLKYIAIGSVVFNTLWAGARLGWNTINASWDAKQARGYVVPERFEAKSADLDLDGKSETVANYNGTNYLFRLGTNGVPYCQPYSIK